MADKKALLKEACNPYLQYCYTQLKETPENLLVFGVSFNNDDHILEALNESIFKEVYITYVDDATKKDIEDKIKDKNYRCLSKKLEAGGFLHIAKEGLIWEKKE